MLRYVAYCFMQVSQVVLQELFYSFFMYLCVCFAYDLHLTIKNPLYPTHKRRKMYTTIQIVIFIWVVFISYGSFADFDDINAFHHIDSSHYFKLRESQKISHSIQTTLLLIVGTYSCINAANSLKEPGLGHNIRNIVIKKRIRFVILTFLSSAPLVYYQAFRT